MKLGDVIAQVDERNRDESAETLLGVAIEKRFMPSVANVIGTDLSGYKVVRKNRFACNPMHVGRDEKLPIARYNEDVPAIVSPAYFTFEVSSSKVMPEYLELWFARDEFDRRCWFATDASVRGGLAWDALCDIDIDIPSLEEQEKTVERFNAINARIATLQQLNDKLVACVEELRLETAANDPTLVDLASQVSMQYGYTDTAELKPVGPKFLRITDITSGSIDWDQVPFCRISSEKYSDYALKPDDVVVARTGVSAGTARYFGSNLPKSVFASFLVRIRSNRPLAQKYIGLTVASPSFYEFVQANAGGSAQPQANPPLLGKFELALPRDEALMDFNRKIVPLINLREFNEMEATRLRRGRAMMLSGLPHV